MPESLRERVTGVVLAGGEGRRLGRPKGALELRGVPLALRAARTLARACDDVVVSIAAGATNPATGFEAVHDAGAAGRGPLAGLAAAWARATRPSTDLLVLACDYPRVEAELLAPLLACPERDVDVVLWCDAEGRKHPLVALWRASARAEVEALLESGASPRVGAVLERLRAHVLGPESWRGRPLDDLLVNVNTEQDLERIERSGRGPR